MRTTVPTPSATSRAFQLDTGKSPVYSDVNIEGNDGEIPRMRTCSHDWTSRTPSSASFRLLKFSKNAGLYGFWLRRGTGLGRACSVPSATRWNWCGFAWYHYVASVDQHAPNRGLRLTYVLSTTGIHPTQGVHQRFTLIQSSTVLGVVLMDVEREKRRIDGRICIEHLERRYT